jgi:glycosidase
MLIFLRKKYAALHKGDIEFLNKGEDDFLMYSRKHENEEIIVLLNFSNTEKRARISSIRYSSKILFSTHGGTTLTSDGLILQPFEGIVVGLFNPSLTFVKE